ncbi:MAG: hypothetical protein WB995_14840 [Candidatus Acidiferrales bacterium]
MHKLWNALRSTLFWSYDRGSWPYDVMVIAILIFVLLTPRKWFNDQPPSTTHAAAAQIEAMIQLVAQDDAAHTRTYRLSANVLPPNKRAQKPTPELEEETHEILGRTVEDLKGRTFQVREIDPIRGEDGSVQYYDVALKL